MKKAVLVFLCIVLMCSFLGGCRGTEPPRELPSKDTQTPNIGEMLCGVMALRCELTTASGATAASSDGTAIVFETVGNDAYLVTNYHVVYNSFSGSDAQSVAKTIKAMPYGAESSEGIDAECVWFSKEYDLAVLCVRGVTDLFPAIAVPSIDLSRRVGITDEVLIAGNTEGAGIALHKGNVSRPSEWVTIPSEYSIFDLSLRLIRYDAAVNRGDSGGGLFASDGTLLGVVNARRTDHAGGYAIPMQTVAPIARQVIDAHKKQAEAAAYRLRFGVNVTEDARKTEYDDTAQMPYAVIDLRVASLTPGCVGTLFLEEGDLLLGLTKNDEKEILFTEARLLEEALLSCRAGDRLVWRYARGESILTYEITVSELHMEAIQ